MQNIRDKKSFGDIGIVIILALITVLSCAQLLFQSGIPHTPNGDLARHVALALFFRDDLQAGQYIPRFQLATGNLQDLPVFQYYGFLSSAASQIGLWLGLPSMNSVILGVALCRLLGLVALFLALKKIGISRISSIIACCAYVFFPYIQTSLYGRVAIPEVCAQGLLPFLFMAYVYTITEVKWLLPILLIALSVLLMTLAHPIFLLWSFVTGLILTIITLSIPHKYHYRHCAILTFGFILGLAISSFQWYPALLSSVDLNVPYAVTSPGYGAALTSLSGFLGLPKMLSADSGEYFFTGAIWVLPVIGLAIFLLYKIRKNQNMVLKSVITGALLVVASFLFLAFSPIDIWPYLPHITYATQLPYRLLAFVGLFSVILLGIVIDKILTSSALKISLGGLIIASSGMSLIAPDYIYGPRLLQQSDAEISAAFPSADYIVTSKDTLIGSDGLLLKDNLFHLPNPDMIHTITIRGHLGVVAGTSGLSLWFAKPGNNESIESDVFTVNGNHFEHTFTIKSNNQIVRLISSKYARPSDTDPKSKDARLLSIAIDGVDLSGENNKIILSSEITREVLRGYARKYYLAENISLNEANVHSLILTLPLAYSRFNEVTQNNQKLETQPNFAGLTLVKVTDMSSPLMSVYKHPVLSTIASVIGWIIMFCIFLCCFLNWLRNNHVVI